MAECGAEDSGLTAPVLLEEPREEAAGLQIRLLETILLQIRACLSLSNKKSLTGEGLQFKLLKGLCEC